MNKKKYLKATKRFETILARFQNCTKWCPIQPRVFTAAWFFYPFLVAGGLCIDSAMIWQCMKIMLYEADRLSKIIVLSHWNKILMEIRNQCFINLYFKVVLVEKSIQTGIEARICLLDDSQLYEGSLNKVQESVKDCFRIFC